MQIDNNYIYSNNLNLYGTNPPVKPLVPMPIGTGVVWPGMNGGEVLRNWIFDNWRHGAVLTAVPDRSRARPRATSTRKSTARTRPVVDARAATASRTT